MQAGSEADAVAAARQIGYPVAVKMNSPDVTHKSDVGGVVLNAGDDAAVRKAFRDLSLGVKRVGARDEGVLVSAMAPAGAEVIVGVVKDLQFGHAVMFGMGGILVEAVGDVAFRIVPLGEKDAAEMVATIRGGRVLLGYRGGRPADVDAIRRLLVQVSELAVRRPDIEELDLNPVIVHERGLQIVDARVILAGER
jgi:acyl-CoA synthetase (NDP forming)